ncbi:hypothetical protein DZK27_06625 [Rhodobacteraceae bacterium 63075]|nr:hypothetical protein DZK27_06625 [Rhodobacteraceae bacterium 63075]
MINKQGLDTFDARLKRISKSEGAGKQLLAGEGEVTKTRVSEADIRKARNQIARKQSSGSLILSVPKWAIAFMLGGVAMLLGRLLGFHVLAGYLAGGDMTMIILQHAGEMAVAIVVLVTVATFAGLRGAMTKTAMTAGLALMLVGEADVARHAPGAWEAMFSADYAASVMQPSMGARANIQTIAAALQNI